MTTNNVAAYRIAVRKGTHIRLRDFSNGLGVSQDETINILLDLALSENENEIVGGLRLRKKLSKTAPTSG